MFKTEKKDTNNYSTCNYNEKIIISNLKNRKKMGVIGISCQFQTIAIQNLMVFSLQLYHQSAHKFCHTNRTMQVQKNLLINQRKNKTTWYTVIYKNNDDQLILPVNGGLMAGNQEGKK